MSFCVSPLYLRHAISLSCFNLHHPRCFGIFIIYQTNKNASFLFIFLWSFFHIIIDWTDFVQSISSILPFLLFKESFIQFPRRCKKGTIFFVPLNSISGNHIGDFKAFYFLLEGYYYLRTFGKKKKAPLRELAQAILV